jgi:hypothetical protein
MTRGSSKIKITLFFFFGLAEQENPLSFCTCLECVINIFADLQLA